jgi:hypothetical protein
MLLEGIMNLSLLNRSNYYKGLLVLSRRDRTIDAREKGFLIQMGEVLGFDKRFCETTINDLLFNANITREPVIFSDERIMKCFFQDALRLAFIDGDLHLLELRWLRSVAHANNQSDRWLAILIRESREKRAIMGRSPLFEIQQYL